MSERAFAGRRLAAVARPLPGLAGGVALADDGGRQGVAAQDIVVVEVLVAQGQGVDALGEKVFEGVLDQVGVAMIGEAGGELADDRREVRGLAEEQGVAVG